MSEQVAGVNITVSAFTQEKTGKTVLKAMEEAKKEKRIFYDAAAVITQNKDGHVHYSETDDMATSKGASWGALAGGIIGILGGPLGVVGAAGAGALIGGLASHGDAGFSDDSLKQLGTALKPNTSALITISNLDFLKTLHKHVKEEDIHATVSNLAEKIASQLNEGTNVVETLFITEEGIAIEQATTDSDAIKVINAALAEEDGKS